LPGTSPDTPVDVVGGYWDSNPDRQSHNLQC